MNKKREYWLKKYIFPLKFKVFEFFYFLFKKPEVLIKKENFHGFIE